MPVAAETKRLVEDAATKLSGIAEINPFNRRSYPSCTTSGTSCGKPREAPEACCKLTYRQTLRSAQRLQGCIRLAGESGRATA